MVKPSGSRQDDNRREAPNNGGALDNLCQHEEALPVHDWQKEILDEREHLIEKGDVEFIYWEEAKKSPGKSS